MTGTGVIMIIAGVPYLESSLYVHPLLKPLAFMCSIQVSVFGGVVPVLLYVYFVFNVFNSGENYRGGLEKN